MSDRPIPVVDLFAGPGGLGEGFASCPNDHKRSAFQVRLSIEVDPDAHTTLELRSFFRQFRTCEAPEEYYQHLRGTLSRQELFTAYPVEAGRARAEAWLAELGKVPEKELHRRITEAVGESRHWVLCGGPPCQAYSVVGRSRRGGIDHADNRLYLYREYLSILAQHEPPVFIMENVKGLLSSQVKGSGLFEQLLADLHAPGTSVGRRTSGAQYHVLSFVHTPHRFDLGGTPRFDPQAFVIRSEQFGVPQSRHRVILLGVRADLVGRDVPTLTPAPREIPVSLVLQGLPKLRSGLSRSTDGPDEWRSTLQEVISSGILKTLPNGHYIAVRRAVIDGLDAIRNYRADRGGEFVPGHASVGYRPEWFIDERIGGVVNHASRPHMASDLHRYLFATAYAKVIGRSPELRDFPTGLLPAHRNVREPGKEEYFDDRFRVQVADRPATAIACHIAIDIHLARSFSPRSRYSRGTTAQARRFEVLRKCNPERSARTLTHTDHHRFIRCVLGFSPGADRDSCGN